MFYRAERQVRAFYGDEGGFIIYASEIIAMFPNRALALAWEKMANFLKAVGHSMDRHFSPADWLRKKQGVSDNVP